MLVIAHRGNNKEALENTFQAFEKSVECGAARIELDLQLSKDKEIFICHDDDLSRIASKNIRISESFASEIGELSLSNGEKIPKLKDMFQNFLPRIEVNCEIKGKSLELTKLAAEMVAASGFPEKVIFSSFCFEPINYLKEEFSFLKRACLTGDDTLCWPNVSNSHPLVFMTETASKILHPKADTVDENLMEYARLHHWLVYPWVPMVGEDENREQLWTTLLSLGVDGLCTNSPRELIEWLDRNKKVTLKDIYL